MHLKYFGTAAAEGVPGMFCTCPVCRESRKLGGKNLRTRSQALVDGSLLIDFPPDTYDHMLRFGLDLPSIETLLLTHAHSDHLYATDLGNRKPGFAYAQEFDEFHERPLRIYATAKAMEHLRAEGGDELAQYDVLELHEITAYEPFQVDDFTVTAMTADHSADHGPVIYAISRNGKTMLYANDTGYFPEETWEYLAKAKLRFDYVSLDCTGMTLQSYRRGHMCFEVNMEVRDRLLAMGCADEKTIFCSHHFSHNGGLTHDAFAEVAAKDGFLTSYDGMEIEF